MTESLRGFLAVLLMGLPGAGKSTLAARLAAHFGLGLLSRDRLREAMFPQGEASPLERRAAFRALLLALEVSVVLGRPVVVDGLTLARRADRERLRALLRRYGAPSLELWLDCPVPVAQARVLADRLRGMASAPDRDAAAVLAAAARFDPVEEQVRRLDATLPPAELAETAIALVRERALDHGLLA
ncbi:MAG: AAA family ATPase [Xanthomonadales bacterium]|nr:AAA family ATPase [Xanthomonadales bacterium]